MSSSPKQNSSSTTSSNSDKWYPGKYVGIRRSSTVSSSSSFSSSSSSSNHPNSPTVEHNTSDGKENYESTSKEKWYPGKYAKRMSIALSTSESTSGGSNGSGSNNSNNGSNSTNDRQSYSVHNMGEIESRVDDTNCIGKITINIDKFKYFATQSCNLIVSIENSMKSLSIHNLQDEESRNLMITLPIHDINSNLLLQFVDQTSQIPFGRVVVHLGQYLTLFKPKPSVLQWHYLYPTYKYNESPDRFRSGYEGIYDYAMSRPVDPIGFVKFSVTIELPKPVYEYLFIRSYVSSNHVSSYSQSEILVKNPDLFQGEIRLKYLRFQRMWTSPPLLSLFLSPPPVFILVGRLRTNTYISILCYAILQTLFFLFYGLEWYHIPFLVLACIYYNGQMSNKERSYSQFIQWNNPVIEARMANANATTRNSDNIIKSTTSGDKTLDAGLMLLLEELDNRLQGLSTNIEKWTNLWNFADDKISGIAYGIATILCLFLSLSIYLLQARLVAYILLSSICLFIAFQDLIIEAANTASEGVTIGSKSLKKNKTIGAKVGVLTKALKNFWSRVPDEMEMFHRYISMKCVVKEGGAEMTDAQNVRKNS